MSAHVFESVYEVAAKAAGAIRALRLGIKPGLPPVTKGLLVSDTCELCGKRHGFILGAPRCTAPLAIPKALCIALALCCLSLSGCAHFYVSGVTLGAGETGSDGKEVTAGITISPNPYSYKAVIPLSKNTK